jgi:hypothetical protein
MNSIDNISAPDPEKKKELKEYSFTRIINETPEKDDSIPNGSEIKFTLTLYDKEISIIAKNENQNSKFPNILYEKYISLETLQSFNKFFSILDTEKIFVIIQKSFEQNFDNDSPASDTWLCSGTVGSRQDRKACRNYDRRHNRGRQNRQAVRDERYLQN